MHQLQCVVKYWANQLYKLIKQYPNNVVELKKFVCKKIMVFQLSELMPYFFVLKFSRSPHCLQVIRFDKQKGLLIFKRTKQLMYTSIVTCWTCSKKKYSQLSFVLVVELKSHSLTLSDNTFVFHIWSQSNWLPMWIIACEIVR